MKYTNIFDKIACLFEIIGSSSIYPIFLGMLFLLTIVLISKKIKNNKVIVLMVINYLILFVITISNHSRTLSRVFDSISTNLFTNIYFPSTQAYLFTLLVIDVITIAGMLNRKLDKAYRISNGICFFSTKFIMALILDVVGQKKVDIFSKKSLFSNTNLVVLLEISIGIFILWLVSLIIIYITNVITNYLITSDMEKKHKEEEYLSNLSISDSYVSENQLLVNDSDDVSQTIEDPVYVIDNNNDMSKDDEIVKYDDVSNTLSDTFSLNDLTISIADELDDNTDIVEEEEPVVDSNILFDRLINNGLPLIQNESNNMEEDKNTYTLNDYKIFNKMLKEIREMNNSNIINIDSRLDLRLKLRYSEEEYSLFKRMIKNYSN